MPYMEERVPMSQWTHRLCWDCWAEWSLEENGFIAVPVQVVHDPWGPCCECSEGTNSGIYVRGDPEEFGCEGDHDLLVEGFPDDE